MASQVNLGKKENPDPLMNEPRVRYARRKNMLRYSGEIINFFAWYESTYLRINAIRYTRYTCTHHVYKYTDRTQEDVGLADQSNCRTVFLRENSDRYTKGIQINSNSRIKYWTEKYLRK